MADNKKLNDEDIGSLAGGLASKEALAGPILLNSPVFKEELLKRLPAGTILDEDMLAKLAGGFGQLAGGLASGLASKEALADNLAVGLAKDFALPDQFASPAELAVWLDAKLKNDIKLGGADGMVKIAKKT